MAEENMQAGWHAGALFYKNLMDSCAKCAESERLLTETKDVRQGAIFLEKWFVDTTIIYKSIKWLLRKEEVAKVEKDYRKPIKHITKGDLFANASLNSDEFGKLRALLEQYNEYIFDLCGRRDLFIPGKIAKSFDTFEEQAEYEGA